MAQGIYYHSKRNGRIVREYWATARLKARWVISNFCFSMSNISYMRPNSPPTQWTYFLQQDHTYSNKALPTQTRPHTVAKHLNT